MMTDPIADMLTRIRNGLRAKHDTVLIPSSGLKKEVARILSEEGFVGEITIDADKATREIEVALKYVDGRNPVIRNIERVSKPGRRIYAGRKEIPWVLSGMGVVILSTPKGVMTGQQARRHGIGGEVLCKVW